MVLNTAELNIGENFFVKPSPEDEVYRDENTAVSNMQESDDRAEYANEESLTPEQQEIHNLPEINGKKVKVAVFCNAGTTRSFVHQHVLNEWGYDAENFPAGKAGKLDMEQFLEQNYQAVVFISDKVEELFQERLQKHEEQKEHKIELTCPTRTLQDPDLRRENANVRAYKQRRINHDEIGNPNYSERMADKGYAMIKQNLENLGFYNKNKENEQKVIE